MGQTGQGPQWKSQSPVLPCEIFQTSRLPDGQKVGGISLSPPALPPVTFQSFNWSPLSSDRTIIIFNCRHQSGSEYIVRTPAGTFIVIH